jgi:methyl-accepting chemotaxis protein
VASAVDQQDAATRDIAANLVMASGGTEEVSANIANVTIAASEVGAAAAQVFDAANGLTRQSEQLRQNVGSFLDAVRAA